jgi:hypothetical protein
MSWLKDVKDAFDLGEEIGREMVRRDASSVSPGTLINLADESDVPLNPVTHEILHAGISWGIKQQEKGK